MIHGSVKAAEGSGSHPRISQGSGRQRKAARKGSPYDNLHFDIFNARNLFTTVCLTVTHAMQMSRHAEGDHLELFSRPVGLKSEVNRWLT